MRGVYALLVVTFFCGTVRAGQPGGSGGHEYFAEVSPTPDKQAVVITGKIQPGTIAALLGLETGDIIAKINQRNMRSARDIAYMLADSGYYDVTYVRNGETRTVRMRLWWLRRSPTPEKTFFLPGERFIPIVSVIDPNEKTRPHSDPSYDRLRPSAHK